jgi:hypothetical protein
MQAIRALTPFGSVLEARQKMLILFLPTDSVSLCPQSSLTQKVTFIPTNHSRIIFNYTSVIPAMKIPNKQKIV